MTPPAPPPLNRQALDTLAELGGEQMVIDLISRFESVMDERMPLLRAAAAKSDATTVEQIAHALASSASTLGAEPLAERLRALEQRAGGGETAAFGAGLGHVGAELVPALAALRDVAGELRAVIARRPTR